ncbi:MAG: hypothetical protein ACOY3I_01100 [Verrucomicrobiota bacterium]
MKRKTHPKTGQRHETSSENVELPPAGETPVVLSQEESPSAATAEAVAPSPEPSIEHEQQGDQHVADENNDSELSSPASSEEKSDASIPPASETPAEEIKTPESLRMRFKNLSPLKRKTLELMRQDPSIDGATAHRLAGEALGLIPPQEPEKNISSPRSSFAPAPGNFGTTQKKILSGDAVLQRLQDLPPVDRKEVLLAVLTTAAQMARR